MDINRAHWDEITPIHIQSAFYDVEGFRSHPNRLKPVELEEVGDVRGKSLLHLQCHFGLDTLSWATLGADVTGVDFSAPAIAAARQLSSELRIPARYIVSNVYDLPDVLDEQFDIVFTSYGAITWLPDLTAWAAVAARFVRPGGFFYVAEFHPAAQALDETVENDVRLRYPYFRNSGPMKFEDPGTYADPAAEVVNRTTYNFPYPLSDVVNAVITSGLRLDFLHEFPFSSYRFIPAMYESEHRHWRLARYDGCLPLTFSLKATRLE